MSISNYECKIRVEHYKSVAIWRLENEQQFPWCAFVDGKNQEFKELEDAKKAIDEYQIIRAQRLEEYCKKYPDLAKYKY